MCEGEAFLVFKREGGQTRRRERAPTGAGGVHLSPFPFFLLPPKQGKRHKERGCERERGGERQRARQKPKRGASSPKPLLFVFSFLIYGEAFLVSKKREEREREGKGRQRVLGVCTSLPSHSFSSL